MRERHQCSVCSTLVVLLCAAASVLTIATAGAAAAARRVVCQSGAYWSGTKCSRCPGGTFGDRPGLVSAACSGLCAPDHFCPPGSVSSTENACGSARYYCPRGSAMREVVAVGHYTIVFPFPVDSSVARRESTAVDRADRQRPCEPGFYCVFGMRRACPAGTFGDRGELTTADCVGPCPAGNYSPEGTSNPLPCPPGTYGATTGLTTAACTALCPIGHYCGSATVEPRSCPPGTYGASRGLTTKACSSQCSTLACIPSPCPAGFYCPLATTTPVPCGSVDVYCPLGSFAPTSASMGFYTTWRDTDNGDDYIEGGALHVLNSTTRSAQRACEHGSYCVAGVKRLCPAGTYGDSDALSTALCSAPCPAGYFCPTGTVSYYRFPCNDRTSYCRTGSPTPTSVSTGYYTVTRAQGDIRVDELICPHGSYCVDGVKHLCPEGTYGATSGLATSACSGRCQDGYICPPGSTSVTQTPCPAGQYSRNGITCAPCAPGYWCTAGSPDPQQNECGSDTVYCPLGSSSPQSVLDGFYATGQQSTTHTAQSQCRVQSVKHVPQCPTRTVGMHSGL